MGRVAGRLDPSCQTWLELQSSQELFSLVCNYAQKHIEDRQSFRLVPNSAPPNARTKSDEPSPPKTCLTLGLGLFRFTWEGHNNMHVLRQHVGDPVGTNCGAARLSSLVLFAEGVGQEALLHAFCEQRLAENEIANDATYSIFRWQIQHQYWRRESQCRARPLASVILPAATKEKVVGDLREFLEDDTQAFYIEHGIPYKRSYLFHGVPGGGKTSLIQALAGEYGRNVCFLQPTHPQMTDDALKAAVQRAPSKAVVVLEDIDALFDQHRGKKQHQTPLTFSGLLNALDGCGNPDGQLFILTTNFKEKLDEALVRCGRVDLHVEFKHCAPEQMEAMFAAFYPQSEAEPKEAGGGHEGEQQQQQQLPRPAVQFREALVAVLAGAGTPDISTASLQHYFIMQRKSSWRDAIANVGQIVDELKRGQMESKKKEGDEEGQKEEEDGADGKGCGKGKSDGSAAEAPAAASPQPQQQPAAAVIPPIHVHMHQHSS
jgi:chaperone BCS1